MIGVLRVNCRVVHCILTIASIKKLDLRTEVNCSGAYGFGTVLGVNRYVCL